MILIIYRYDGLFIQGSPEKQNISILEGYGSCDYGG